MAASPSDELFEVEYLLAAKCDTDGAASECFIKWAGYPDAANSWEPIANILDDDLRATVDTHVKKRTNWIWEYSEAQISPLPLLDPSPASAASGATLLYRAFDADDADKLSHAFSSWCKGRAPFIVAIPFCCSEVGTVSRKTYATVDFSAMRLLVTPEEHPTAHHSSPENKLTKTSVIYTIRCQIIDKEGFKSGC